jgi:tetratricopeptide (TPR) repeat protein
MAHALSSAFDMVCSALTLPIIAWVMYRSYSRSDDRKGLVVRWIFSGLMILVIWGISFSESPIKVLWMLLPACGLGFLWIPVAIDLMSKPLTNAFDGGREEGEAKPFYYAAEGKRRKGHYEEAIADIRQQLELFPGDFEGYMKLASIQMENMNHFVAAQATLNEFLDIPGRSPNEVTAVLHLLADWQLQDNRGAREAVASLQRIVELFPGTAFAHAAEQRIARLGTADEARRARHEVKFAVKPGEQNIGLRQSTASAASADPRALADVYTQQLNAHPSDTDTREKLATLYAEEFQRIDLAAEQLEQLIAIPSEPPKHIAHWLNLLATLQIKCSHDLAAAERALHRIIERFPGGALAEVATRRLAGLQSELKSLDKPAVKALGTYEKGIGLKRAHQ